MDRLRDEREFDYARDEWDRSGNPDSSGNSDYRDDFAPRGGNFRQQDQGYSDWNENRNEDYRSGEAGGFEQRYDENYPEREFSGRGQRGSATQERGQRRDSSSRREHSVQRSR